MTPRPVWVIGAILGVHALHTTRGVDRTIRGKDTVLYGQTLTFSTRAMVAQGLWQPQPDNPAPYPNVPAASGHRADLATFVANAGAVPDFGDVYRAFGPWDQPATRGWFARVLCPVLDRY